MNSNNLDYFSLTNKEGAKFPLQDFLLIHQKEQEQVSSESPADSKLKGRTIIKSSKLISNYKNEKISPDGLLKSFLKKIYPIKKRSRSCIKITRRVLNLISTKNPVRAEISLNLLRVLFDYYEQETPVLANSLHVEKSTQDSFYTYLLSPLRDPVIKTLNKKFYDLIIYKLIPGSGPNNHHLIALIHKTVRLTLQFLKRLSSDPQSHVFKDSEPLNELNKNIAGLFECKLDLPLDVRCNLGLAHCYILKIKYGDTMKSKDFFTPIFTTSVEKIGHLPKRFTYHLRNPENYDMNRIGIVFGNLRVSPINDEFFKERMEEMALFIFSLDHGTKECVNLGSARLLETWIEKLYEGDIKTAKELVSLFSEIEFFIFTFLPGHIDAVKSCGRNILKKLVQIYAKIDQKLLLNLLQKVMEKESHVKWIAISCITAATPKSIVLLQVNPNMPLDIIASERTMKNSASESYLSLMTYDYFEAKKSGKEEIWKETWIAPLFFSPTSIGSAETNWAQKKGILSKICENEEMEGAISLLLQYVKENIMGNSNKIMNEEALLLGLELFKIGEKFNNGASSLTLPNYPRGSFKGIVDRKTLNAWTWISSPEIRLGTFSLLVESKKSSEVVTAEDFDSIKLAFKYSLVTQNPAFRQQFFSIYKRFLKRLRDSRNFLLRQVKSSNTTNECQSYLNFYAEFFNWLWEFLTEIEGQFPGTNFGRRCQSLELLSEFLNWFSLDELNIELPTTSFSLLANLFDSFEYNKKISLPILQKLFSKRLSEDKESWDKLLQTSYFLLESIHPPDSVTGRYLGLFLVQKTKNFTPYNSLCEIFENIYAKLDGMLQEIKKVSLTSFVTSSQMYGYFRFLRMLLTDSNQNLFRDDFIKYRGYFSKMIKLCFEYNAELFPVLGNAAPEGFLPGLPDSDPESLYIIRSLNAQRLLVCSWRSMRDICLFLNDMVGLLPLENEDSNWIISNEAVTHIGQHLLYLLHNLMHRGVFEQVFTGFKQLAQRLFKSKEPLSTLPNKWLNDALEVNALKKKCITRRSGGIPFIFQALLAPRVSHDTFFEKHVNNLFSLGTSSNDNVLIIHSMNILRALFKDALFSRAIMPYVPRGLFLAFAGLKSSDWNVCNAGLMLYGSIIKRTFGQKLNLMSAPTFFRKFPEMEEYLLTEVKKCSEGVVKIGKSGGVDFSYYILILLSSFATSGVVEYGNNKLYELLPWISKCSSSPDELVREISARAILPFLPNSQAKFDYLKTVLSQFKNNAFDLNTFHGYLLQILSILKSIPNKDLSFTNLILNEISDAILKNHWIWNKKRKCPIIYSALGEIYIFSQSQVQNHEKMEIFIKYLISSYEEAYGNLSCREKVPALLDSDEILCKAEVLYKKTFLFNEKRANIKKIYFNQALILLAEKNTNFSSLEAINVAECYLDLCKNDDLTETDEAFLKCFINPQFNISEIKAPEQVLRLLKKFLKICHDDIGEAAVKGLALSALGKIVLNMMEKLDYKTIQDFCDILLLWTDANMDFEMRISVAGILQNLSHKMIIKFTGIERFKILSLFFILIQDDEEEVRKKVSSSSYILDDISSASDRKALEVLLSKLCHNFANDSPLETLSLLLALILRDDYDISILETEDNEEDEHIFDRSEMNSYCEPVLLLKIFNEFLSDSSNAQFKQLFKETFKNCSISDESQALKIFSLVSLRDQEEVKNILGFCPEKSYSSFCNQLLNENTENFQWEPFILSSDNIAKISNPHKKNFKFEYISKCLFSILQS